MPTAPGFLIALTHIPEFNLKAKLSVLATPFSYATLQPASTSVPTQNINLKMISELKMRFIVKITKLCSNSNNWQMRELANQLLIILLNNKLIRTYFLSIWRQMRLTTQLWPRQQNGMLKTYLLISKSKSAKGPLLESEVSLEFSIKLIKVEITNLILKNSDRV